VNLLLIALGGATGSVLRYLTAEAVQRATHVFPLGTFVVNVAGSFLVGVLSGLVMNAQTHPMIRPALIVGFCGGFTTFSTFSIETVGLINGGEAAKAGLYVAASVAFCIAGAALGFRIAAR
jgi:fluoride exporter